ncbi:MAG TPA: hypothetical protein DIU15_21050 [Deltaproteobacteria bacterium]|nr:hypothetical protein [Deltaproteobacteria bacterium]HCP48539.1 hypothetical protein [Deltaproteobacteria bacterium]
MRHTHHLQHVLIAALSAALLPLSSALAAGSASGHYNRDEVASSSAVFRGFANNLQQVYGPIDDRVRRVDGLLADLDLNLALTAGHVDQAHHDLWSARLDERSTRFGPEFEAVQELSYSVQDQSTRAFEQALQRALETLASASDLDLEPCVESSSSIGPMGALGGSASTCPGIDQSQSIAALWDKDSQLRQDLDGINSAQWPAVTTYNDSPSPLGLKDKAAVGQWLSPAQLARGIPEAVQILETIGERAQAGRDTLWSALRAAPEDKDQAAELKQAIRTRAKRIRDYSAAQQAALGVVLWSTLDRARKKGKKAGWSDVALCINPTGWGGCEGTDRTDEVLDALYDDKKLTRQLETLLNDLPRPDVALP